MDCIVRTVYLTVIVVSSCSDKVQSSVVLDLSTLQRKCSSINIIGVVFISHLTLLARAVTVIQQSCVGEVKLETLYQRLFNNYTTQVLPKCENQEAVQVRVGLALRQIIDLNEPRQILETNTWVRLIWNDCNLQWNATETGIKNMVVPFKNIWVPDITLYDNAQNELGGLTDFRPDVYPDGTIYYNFPSVIKSLCKVDVTYFPFDTQQCKMKFGSWSSHGFDVNVSERVPAGDPSMFVANGEWELIGLPSIRHEIMYACCPQPYPDVTFFIQIRRKPLFYLLNLIFPCTLISTVAFLGFLLPPDSGEKISLEITVLLSLAVFLLVVSETMPPDSETFPYIGVYFACAMLLVSMSCLMTVTVLNLHFKGNFGKKMPNWVRKVFLHGFGRILHVKVTAKDTNIVHEHRNNVDRFHETHDNAGYNVHPEDFRSDISNHENNINKILNDLNETTGKQVNLPPEFDYDTSNELVRILKQQLDCLNSIKGHIDEKRELEDTMEDWKKLAQVVDRIFMVLFFAFQCITTLFILLKISTTDIPLEIE